jgi:D,D-heptose 1,7-bisphosphate phosphatase
MAIEVARPRAVFLDKDGTLIEDIPYNADPDLIKPVEGALESLLLMQGAGYQLIVVSNQSGIARGFFPEQALIGVERRLRQILSAAGVTLTDFYYCPHHPHAAVREYAVQCACRKPQPGMLFQAAREHQLDLHASWMVGDILDDVEAGNAAGCRTVLVDNGHETEWEPGPARKPGFTVRTLLEAARLVAGSPSSHDSIVEHDDKQQRSPEYH